MTAVLTAEVLDRITKPSPRYRWLIAAGTAACLGLLAACNGSSTNAGPTAASPLSSASPAQAAVSSAAPAADASAALRRAIAETKTVRSYRFNAEQRVTGGPSPQVTRLTGRVLRPSNLTYTLVSAGQTQQIVRLGAVTYRRVPPGPYKRIVKAAPIVDPLGSVTGILTRLTDVTSASTTGGTDVSGALSGADAAAAGLVGNAAPGPGLAVPVRARVDTHGRVTRLELSAPLQAGSQRLVLRQITTYGGFNAQPPIARPR